MALSHCNRPMVPGGWHRGSTVWTCANLGCNALTMQLPEREDRNPVLEHVLSQGRIETADRHRRRRSAV